MRIFLTVILTFLFSQSFAVTWVTCNTGTWGSNSGGTSLRLSNDGCTTLVNPRTASFTISSGDEIIFDASHDVTISSNVNLTSFDNLTIRFRGDVIFNNGKLQLSASSQIILENGATLTCTGDCGNNDQIDIGGTKFKGDDLDDINDAPRPTSVTEGGITLPITLGSISHQVTPNSIIIHFTTTKEENFSHFEIQRSRDGRSWEVIGEVKGHGNTTEVQAYAFEDRLPLAGLSYYRLNAIDIDGTQEYHGMLSVLFNPGEQSINIYPNPVTSRRFSLQASFELRQGAKISVLDMVGSEILTEVYDGFANEFILPARVKSGLYVVLISQDGITYQKKLLVK